MLRIYDDVLAMVRDAAVTVDAIARRDPGLADQMRRAAQSVALNCGEGMYSRGRNEGARFQTALGSMRETLSCIEVATAFGYIAKPDAKVLDRIDKILATLYRLVH